MNDLDERKLLRNKRVVDEIERYRWIESEKCGYDIGFRKAADHWVIYYALAWLKYHSPNGRKYRLRKSLRSALRA